MKHRWQKIAILVAALALATSFAVASPASAQIGSTVNAGLGFGTIVGWGTQDLRTTIMLVIQILLGFLGVVAIVIILYAGFLWMTAGGNPEQISRAKRILVEAVIGLAIIFGAFAIVSFIVRSLAGATGPQAGGPGPGPLPGPGFGGGQCVLVSSGPHSPPKQCMNSPVRVNADAAVSAGTVIAANFQVQLVQAEGAALASKASGETCSAPGECHSGVCRDADGNGTTECVGDTVPGQFSVVGARMEFTPDQACPPAFPGLKCFGKFSTYQVSLRGGSLRCAPPDRPFQCGGQCQWQFETSDCVDITPPTLALTSVNFCQGPNGTIAFATTDDAGVDVVDFYDVLDSGAQVSLGTVDPASDGLDERNATGNFTFNASGLSVGQHRIRAVATDFDAHATVSETVVNVWPVACCNGQLDPGESATDCGGSCGACEGDCDIDSDPNVCQPNQTACAFACSATSCTCIAPPFIDYVSPARDASVDNPPNSPSDTDPYDDDVPFGAPGNLVTIIGRNFGAFGPGSRVEFTKTGGGWTVAQFAQAVNPACGNTWTDSEIVVVVPVDAAPGPIKVTTSDGLSDATDQPNPPRSSERSLPDFDVNATALPGLCKLENPNRPTLSGELPAGVFKEKVVVYGLGLDRGVDLSDDHVLFGGQIGALSTGYAWDPPNKKIDGVLVPNLVPADIRVWVKLDGSKQSNTLGFTVRPGIDHPVILDFDPKRGPVGQYVTIVGANFGARQGRGTVRFACSPGPGCSGGKIAGDFTFPPQCGANFWTDSRILVKVPAGAEDGPLEVETNGGLNDTTDNDNGPRLKYVVDGLVGPGICQLVPDNGPAGVTPVAITGERMDAATEATFTRAAPVSGIHSRTAGTDRLDVTVPVAAQTGDVFVTTAAGRDSNKLPFTVGDCRSSESCAGGSECCGSGPFVGSCMPAGQCGGLTLRSAYRWHFITGKAGPQVVTRCTRTLDCSRGGYSSPTPPHGSIVPINALISASFDQLVDESTLTLANVIVRACANPATNEDPGDCASGLNLTSNVQKNHWTYNGIDAHWIEIKIQPTSGNPLAKNTWYQVTLTNNIRSPSGDQLAGNQVDGNYVWRFRAQDSDETGRVGCLGCQPSAATMVSRGETVGLNGLAYEKDQVCVLLDTSRYAWQWQSADASLVRITDSVTSRETATAQAETDGTNVTTKIPREAPGESAACTIAVHLDTPVVIERWPNCSSACVNAQIGAAFSLPIDNAAGSANRAEDTTNVKLFTCGANYTCPLGASLSVPVDNLKYDLDAATNRSQIQFAPAASHNGVDTNGDGVPDLGRLIPGVYYRVVLESDTDGPGPDAGLASPEGKGLGGLNFDVDGDGRVDAYSWVFKVREDFNECEVARVDVIPPAVQAFPPTVVPYRAQPYSTPDACNTAGQRLTPYSYQWGWRSGDRAVAQMLTPLRDACGNGVLETGEECDDGNVDSGDGCSGTNPPWTDASVIGPCVAERDGDTGNANYHQTVCGNGVVENDGDGVPGATEEQCDDGNTQDGDGCSRTCLLEGSRAGQSRCGDGIVGAGESCETCGATAPFRTIYGGSCAASDRALNRATVSGDGCSNRCTAETDSAGVAITGNPRVAPYPVCGNGRVDAGEECDTVDEPNNDPGDGCTDNCLLTGSVYEIDDPPTVGPRQFAQAQGVGKTDIIAEVQQTNLVSGVGVFEVPRLGGTGLGLFQIIGYQPSGNQRACLTEQIVVRFSNQPDVTTIRNNLANFSINNAAVDGARIQSRLDNIIAVNPPAGDWQPETIYAVQFTAGVRNINGQSLNCDASHPCDWTFTTGTQRCEITDIQVKPVEAVVQPEATQVFEAKLVGEFIPASVVDNAVTPVAPTAQTPQLINFLGCDLGNFICVESLNGADFTIQATSAQACGGTPVGGDPGKSRINARNVVSLGCGLGLDFSQIHASSRKGKWWLELAPSRQVSVTATTDYRWSYTHLREPAVAAATASDTNKFKYTVTAVNRWEPFVGIRQADIRASYPPEGIAGTARLIVGNLCAEPYRSTNLYALYPLQPDSDTAAIGHFDGTPRLTLANGAALEPKLVSPDQQFVNGLQDAAESKTLGQAVAMGDGQGLVYPASQILSATTNGSLSLWYRPSPAAQNPRTLFSVGDPGNDDISLVLDRAGAPDDVVKFTYLGSSVTVRKPVDDDVWHLITGSWVWRNGQIKLRLMVDDELQDPITEDKYAMILTSDAEVRIGHNAAGDNPAMGAFDELEFSRAAWTEDEMRARHEAYLGECLGGAVGAPKVLACTPDADTATLECNSGASIQCTNPLISVTFDQAMDPATILHQTAGTYDRILLCPDSATACDRGKTLISGLRYDSISHAAEVTKLLSATSLDKALELKMSFDRPGFADDQGRHTGQCSGGGCPTWTSDGRVGGGIEFDGRDDFLNVGQILPPDSTKPFTLAAWVKPSAKTVVDPLLDNNYRTIIGTDGSWAEITLDEGKSVDSFSEPAIMRNGGDDEPPLACQGWEMASGGLNAIQNGEWHHVVGIYNGTHASLYVDGSLVAGPILQSFCHDGNSDGTADPPGVTLLGRFTLQQGHPYELFSGTMDDVRIWKRALKEAEVGQLYSGSVLLPGQKYQVKIADGFDGVLSATNLPLAANSLSQFDFTIAPTAGPCACDYARILVNPPNPPQYRFQDAFSCAGNACVGDVLLQDSNDPKTFGNQHSYEARCFDRKTNVAVSNVKYQWQELYDIADSVVVAAPLNEAAVYARNTLQNGDARLAVTATGGVTTAGTAEAFLDVTNFVCANPWPNPWQFPFKDTDAFPLGLGPQDNKDPFTNFSLFYCRDVNQTETANDDLPALPAPPTVIANSLPKQFLFPLNYFQETQAIQTIDGVSIKYSNNPNSPLSDRTKNQADAICVALDAHPNTPDGSDVTYLLTIPETGHYQVAFEVVHFDPDFELPAEVSIKIGPGSELQPQRLPSLRGRQIVTYDLGQQSKGPLEVKLWYKNNDFSQSSGEEIFAVCRVGLGLANIKTDAIGVQVFANPWRLSPATWYASGVCEGAPTPPTISPTDLTGVCFSDRDCLTIGATHRCAFNIPNRGKAPQSTTVNGYPAIRDGRTIYVGATNLTTAPSGGVGHCSLTQETSCKVPLK